MDEWHQRGLMVLPAIRSIAGDGAGSAALRAGPLAPPHHEGFMVLQLIA